MPETAIPQLETIYDYMKLFAQPLGQRILQEFPALQGFEDPVSPRLKQLLRRPFPAQAIAIMGVAKRWEDWKTAAIVAECGTGKTLMSLAAIHVHADGKPYTAIAMVPPHLVNKWAREALQTVPGLRVFMIDDLRNGGDPQTPHGVNEVKLQGARIVRKGLHTTLTDMRLRKGCASARERWERICSGPSLFIVGRERAKLGYFWRHAYVVPKSGPNRDCLVNAESGLPVIINEERLTCGDLKDTKIAEQFDQRVGNKRHKCRPYYAPMWQADAGKILREAPIDFIGRYLHGFFDYAICDEMHQLAGDTAQGNALGTLASCSDRIVGLTGTLMGGYAKDLNNLLWRLESAKMKEKGFVWGSSGCSGFVSEYGVLETIETTEPRDNDCSDARVTTVVKHKPGASPALFGEFLMSLCAFVFLEDIADKLPPYEEVLVDVPMDKAHQQAYDELEQAIKISLQENRKNRSVLSKMLNTLLLYPDHPFGIGTIWGKRKVKTLGRKSKSREWEQFVIAVAEDLPQNRLYSKERKLIEMVKAELAEGRLCHVFAVYTHAHDVPARISKVLEGVGIRTAILRPTVNTTVREAWYAKKVSEGVQVVISHPKLVETGLDLLDFPTLIFYESGYSLHTLRQASRRSWRIGQSRRVRVFFLCQEGTMQTKCLRLMGKKLLVALTIEGKFASEGLHDIEDDDDILASLARELVEKDGIGKTADAIWSELKGIYDQMPAACQPSAPREDDWGVIVPTAGRPADDHVPFEDVPLVMPPMTQAELLVASAIQTSAPSVFGQTLSPKRRTKRHPTYGSDQQSLFPSS
jgi:superfamily II DNA or RNA helicase